MTSHDVVAIARRALGTRKVGHAGTLDPMATGILVLGFNNGTRLLQYITNGNKTYEATVVLGAATVTDDVEGEVISQADVSAITDAQIEAEMAKIMPQEEALQTMREAIEKAVGTTFNDDSSLMTSLSALGQQRIKLTTDLSSCQLKLSKTNLLKAYVVGNWIVKIYANKKSN